MIKVGMIGAGLSAKVFHLPFLNTLTDTYEIAAISTSRPEAIAAQTNAKVYPDAETLISQADVDLVIVTVPNEAHYHCAKLALEHGKHVVVEKPLVETVDEALSLYQLAKQQGKILTAYQNRRWDGDFLTLKSLLDSEQLGKIHYFESHFDRFYPTVRDKWREKPGVAAGFWFDLGSHTLDQAISLFGLPQAVTGRCLVLREGGQVNDYAHVMLHYADKEVILHVSPFAAAPNMRFHVQGTQGSFIKYGLDPQEVHIMQDGIQPGQAGFGVEDESNHGTLYTADTQTTLPTQVGNYAGYYQDLANAINTGKPQSVSIEQVIDALYLLNLAIESSEKGQTLVVQSPLK